MRYAPDVDEQRYGALLAEARPRIIETPEEHERLLGLAESLMEKGDLLSEEEEKLLALTVLLIEAFELSFASDDDEEEGEPEEPPAPHVTLQRLMHSHSLSVEDVSPMFGNPYIAKEVLEGKREISKRQAKELGKYFRVPPKLFAPNA
jgi:HTH-type transcriptional regulator / antitoxin HigA